MKVLKWVGIVLGSLVGVALAAAVVFGLMGGRSVSANHAG